MADSISDPGGRAEMREFRKIAISPDAVARAILFAMEQQPDLDVSEIIGAPDGEHLLARHDALCSEPGDERLVVETLAARERGARDRLELGFSGSGKGDVHLIPAHGRQGNGHSLAPAVGRPREHEGPRRFVLFDGEAGEPFE